MQLFRQWNIIYEVQVVRTLKVLYNASKKDTALKYLSFIFLVMSLILRVLPNDLYIFRLFMFTNAT
jgi:hypothetical protein